MLFCKWAWSRSFPADSDDTNFAPQNIQNLFERHLEASAQREQCTAAEFVDKKLLGVVYDYTLNFMSGHTIHHNDEYKAEGPGYWISNLGLQGEGLVCFFDALPRIATTLRGNLFNQAPSIR